MIYVGFGDAGIIRRFGFPFSLVLLLTFALLNRRHIGFLIAALGISLNLLPVLANGGLMPVSPANMEKSGHGEELADLELGDAVPFSKNVLLEEDDTHLQFLSDRFAWDSPGLFSVFSIGDVIIAAAFLMIVSQILLPALQRESQPSET